MIDPDPPIVAILRGLEPDEAPAIGAALVAAGIRALEVPLNSPRPFESLRRLRASLPNDIALGAGTVLSADEVGRAAEAGAAFIVAPNFDPAVVRAAKAASLAAMPGVATPSEAFAAVACGADILKMFPAEQMPPAVVKAWRAVLPPGTRLYPVGGITTGNIAAYLEAGADGFGVGSSLYRPGDAPEAVEAAARRLVAAFPSRRA
ncbi:MAG: 2-dehydro-3-deoxy-6-phosphogalactonate aldolase [Rhodospirillales bacterium]|nr:2-dehydro-3-deoxy-6-phosphogalactonate aldolase [Rhodospirillales bacterium]